MARIRDGRARRDAASRRLAVARIAGFWLLFGLAGWGGVHLIDRLVMSSSRSLAGGRDDVAGLPGRWGDGRVRAEVKGLGGRLTILIDTASAGGTVRHEAFVLAERPGGLIARDPVFESAGDPRVTVRLVGDRLLLDVSGSYTAGLPAHAELRRAAG